MRSIEELLREIKNRGLFLANLYERRTFPDNKNVTPQSLNEWRAAVTWPGGHRDEDVGANAAEALEAVLERAKGLKGPENRPQTKHAKGTEIDLDDLI